MVSFMMLLTVQIYYYRYYTIVEMVSFMMLLTVQIYYYRYCTIVEMFLLYIEK